VLSHFPDIVVIYVGVNDVWQKLSVGYCTDQEKFQEYYYGIISKLQAANVKVVVCTPAVIGEKKDYSNELDNDLECYSSIIKDIAATYQLPSVDLRAAFIKYNSTNNTDNEAAGTLTTDGVHLNEKGNQVVAESILRVLKEVK
jgi:lysophospholipase L1-like esterase